MSKFIEFLTNRLRTCDGSRTFFSIKNLKKKRKVFVLSSTLFLLRHCSVNLRLRHVKYSKFSLKNLDMATVFLRKHSKAQRFRLEFALDSADRVETLTTFLLPMSNSNLFSILKPNVSFETNVSKMPKRSIESIDLKTTRRQNERTTKKKTNREQPEFPVRRFRPIQFVQFC